MPIPTDILKKVSYHAVYDESIIEALRYAHASGFAGIQVAVEMPHLSFSRLGTNERRAIRDICRKTGIVMSLHGHDDMASLFESEPHLARGIFDYLAAMLDFAEETEAKLLTLHCGSVPRFRTDTEPEQTLPAGGRRMYREALAANLGGLVKLNRQRSVICIENNKLGPMICEALQPHIDRGELFLCWDLAKHHMALRENDRLSADFMLANMAAVRQVHLHDVSDARSHKVIGTGDVDFLGYLAMLPDDETRDYCIEVRPREKALESMKNLQKMLSNEAMKI